MSLSKELEQLAQLHAEGKLTDQEFAEAKTRLLEDPPSSFEKTFGTKRDRRGRRISSPEEINEYCMWIHLAQFAGFVVPLAGAVIPIVLWQIRVRDNKMIDWHGRMVTNWIISSYIYAVVFTLLCYILIGFPLLLGLIIASVAFPIFGAVQANKGKAWKYPGTIPFFRNPLADKKGSYKSDRKQRDFRSNRPGRRPGLNN